MTLDEDIPVDIFGLFVHWLYTQQLCHPGLEPQNLELMELSQLWTLAGRFLVPKLQHQVMHEYFYAFRGAAMPDALNLLQVLEYLYETEEETLLKVFAVYQVVVWNKTNSSRVLCAPTIGKLPRGMLVDLSKLLLKQARGESIFPPYKEMLGEGGDANL